MEDQSAKTPLFKKMDQTLFEQMDLFKKSSNYNSVQDFYNGLDEEQQKVFKAAVVAALFLIPLMLLTFLWWQNSSVRQDLHTRTRIVTLANQILSQKRGLRDIAPSVLSPNPIDSQSMMTSRLSTVLSGIGVDLNKIQVSQFNSTEINKVMKSEARFAFTNASTAELMNLFTAMINREKFRIQSVEIKRNTSTNLLQGQFQAIHFSSVTSSTEED